MSKKFKSLKSCTLVVGEITFFFTFFLLFFSDRISITLIVKLKCGSTRLPLRGTDPVLLFCVTFQLSEQARANIKHIRFQKYFTSVVATKKISTFDT